MQFINCFNPLFALYRPVLPLKRQQYVDREVRPAVVEAVKRSKVTLIDLAKDVIVEYLRPALHEFVPQSGVHIVKCAEDLHLLVILILFEHAFIASSGCFRLLFGVYLLLPFS